MTTHSDWCDLLIRASSLVSSIEALRQRLVAAVGLTIDGNEEAPTIHLLIDRVERMRKDLNSAERCAEGLTEQIDRFRCRVATAAGLTIADGDPPPSDDALVAVVESLVRPNTVLQQEAR